MVSRTVFDQIEEKEDRVHAYLDLYKKEAYTRAKQVEKGIAGRHLYRSACRCAYCSKR